MRIVMTRGLPASGKTSWAKEFMEYQPEDWYRWNNDDFSYMLTGRMHKYVDYRFLLQRRRGFILGAVRAQTSFIIDNTNLNPYTTYEVQLVLDELGIDIEIEDIYFPVRLEDAIERDAVRDFPVGEKVIRRMHNKWIDQWPQLKVE